MTHDTTTRPGGRAPRSRETIAASIGQIRARQASAARLRRLVGHGRTARQAITAMAEAPVEAERALAELRHVLHALEAAVEDVRGRAASRTEP